MTCGVVIVGGGPVGLTLALALARQRVPSIVLEEDMTVCDGSRALGMSRRTQDIWDALGIGNALATCGQPWDSGWAYYRRSLILHYRVPNDPSMLHPPMLNLPQSQAERFLVDATARTGLIDLRWGSRLDKITVDADGVSLDVSGPKGAQRIRSDYVVACDGARSPVRSQLGLRMEGTSGGTHYLIVDVRISQDLEMGRRVWFDSISNPGATVLMHGQPNRVWRIDWQIDTDQDIDAVTAPESIRARVARHLEMLGISGPWEIVWFSAYRAHARTLGSYRAGRVILAGDAAHLIPIFGIRGLNSGVEDAWNLAWKLAAVLRRQSGDALLDSYSDERVAAARENLRLATRTLNFMTPPTRGSRLLRDAVLSLAVSQSFMSELINPRQGTFVPLTASPLNTISPATGAGLVPGDVLPNFRLNIRGHAGWIESALYRTLGPGFTLIWFGDAGAAPDLRRRLQAYSILRIVVVTMNRDDELADAYDETGIVSQELYSGERTLYLIRPDDHIAAAWSTADPEAIERALERATCSHEIGPAVGA